MKFNALLKTGIFTLLLTFMVGSVQAQSWQVGVHQGISYWLTRKSVGIGRLRTLPGQHLTWDKELAVKYQSNRKLGFELGLGTYHFRQQTPGATSNNLISVDGHSYALSLRMALLYDVTYPLIGYLIPKMAGMKSFIGFTCTPTFLWDNAAIEPAADASYQLCRTSLHMWVGFSYSHEVPLTKNVLLVSQFAFQGRPFIQYRKEQEILPLPNKRMSIQSGIRIKL